MSRRFWIFLATIAVTLGLKSSIDWSDKTVKQKINYDLIVLTMLSFNHID